MCNLYPENLNWIHVMLGCSRNDMLLHRRWHYRDCLEEFDVAEVGVEHRADGPDGSLK